jgi:hypothetical protein
MLLGSRFHELVAAYNRQLITQRLQQESKNEQNTSI